MADIGVFMNLGPIDPEGRMDPEPARRQQTLHGGLPNYTIDPRYGDGDYNGYPSKAMDLVKSNPNARLFVASCWPTATALNAAMKALRITPLKGVVYAGVTTSTSEPAQGYDSNLTGMKSFEIANLCPNWPSLLKQIAPAVKRVAVIYDFDPTRPCMGDQYSVITASATAPPLGLSVARIDARLGAAALKSAIDGFVSADPTSPAGLIVTAGTLTAGHRLDIFAAGNNLPVIYPSNLYTDSRKYSEATGLISYGADVRGLYERVVSGFLVPILSQPGPTDDIRTRFPPLSNTNFDLIVNQKAAQAVGISTIPPMFTVTINGTSQQIRPTIVTGN